MRMQAISVVDALIVNFCMDSYLDSFNGVLRAIAGAISGNWAMGVSISRWGNPA